MNRIRIVFFALLVAAGLSSFTMPVRADDDCVRRIHQAEDKLRDAIAKHGEDSPQARKRREQRFAGLDTATWQVPAANIGVRNQEHFALAIEDHRPHAERQSPAKAPKGMENPPYRGFEWTAKWAQGHRRIRAGK